MRANSAFPGHSWNAGPSRPSGWIGATPRLRKRLLALAMVGMFLPAHPGSADAQDATGASVRLVIRAGALPPGAREADAQAFPWMAPESIDATERLARQWASGDEAGALEAWQAIVTAEVEAHHLATERQADAAARWISGRATILAAREAGITPGVKLDRTIHEILGLVRSMAVTSIEAHERETHHRIINGGDTEPLVEYSERRVRTSAWRK